MKSQLLLGIDIGTSSVKIGLHNERGKTVAMESVSYSLTAPAPGQYEIQPDVLFETIVGAILRITNSTKESDEIVAVAICGMMIMPVYLDAHCRVVRPVIHWQDERLFQQFSEIRGTEIAAEASLNSGSMLTGESTINSITWLRKAEPENFRKVSVFICIKDYIRFRLTGVLCTDYGDASGTMLLDPRSRSWNSEIVKELGLSASALPDVASGDSSCGRVTAEAAKRTHLSEGTPVAVGTGDGICTLIGLGVVKDGVTGITVGSAGVVGTVTSSIPLDKQQRNYVFCHPNDGIWYSVMATAASGDVLRWYKDQVLNYADGSYRDLEAEAQDIEPTISDVMFVPYILGSRNPHGDPNAAATFLGLRKKHSRGHLTRAVLEGILLEIADLLKVQTEITGKGGQLHDRLRISGGIVKSMFWVQMLSDIVGGRIDIPEVKELGVLGCAVLAATSIGMYNSVGAAAESMTRTSETLEYDALRHEFYCQRLEMFRAAYKHGMTSLPSE